MTNMIRRGTAVLLLLAAASACEGVSTTPGSHELALGEENDDGAGAAVDARGPAPIEPGALAAAWATWTPADPLPASADLDQDGVRAEEDPDDENPTVYPGAPEIQCNDTDEDGDGVDSCPPDADGDGARADLDCDDLDPTVSPLLGDTVCNGRDEDCNGHDDCDSDGDGAMDWYDLDPGDPMVGVPDVGQGEGHVSL